MHQLGTPTQTRIRIAVAATTPIAQNREFLITRATWRPIAVQIAWGLSWERSRERPAKCVRIRVFGGMFESARLNG